MTTKEITKLQLEKIGHLLTGFDKLKSRVNVLPYNEITKLCNATHHVLNVSGKANIEKYEDEFACPVDLIDAYIIPAIEDDLLRILTNSWFLGKDNEKLKFIKEHPLFDGYLYNQLIKDLMPFYFVSFLIYINKKEKSYHGAKVDQLINHIYKHFDEQAIFEDMVYKNEITDDDLDDILDGVGSCGMSEMIWGNLDTSKVRKLNIVMSRAYIDKLTSVEQFKNYENMIKPIIRAYNECSKMDVNELYVSKCLFATKDLDYKKEVYIFTTEADADIYFKNIVLSDTWDRNNLHLVEHSITCYGEKLKDFGSDEARSEIQSNIKLYGFGYASIFETVKMVQEIKKGKKGKNESRNKSC